MNTEIRKVKQKIIICGDYFLEILFYEDINELVEFSNEDIWSDIEKMY